MGYLPKGRPFMDILFLIHWFDNMNQTADNCWEIIEISIIALAFTANVLNQWEFCI